MKQFRTPISEEKKYITNMQRHYAVLGFFCVSIPMLIGIAIIDYTGFNIKPWWILIITLPIISGFWGGALFARTAYKKTMRLNASTFEIGRAHYIWSHAKWVALILLWVPVLPIILMLMKVKVGSYLSLGVILLWNIAKSTATSKAAKESGYTPL